MSVAAFKWGSNFFGTIAIERWRLCPLLWNWGELRMLGPIAYDRGATVGLPSLRQKRPRCVHLVTSGCSQWGKLDPRWRSECLRPPAGKVRCKHSDDNPS